MSKRYFLLLTLALLFLPDRASAQSFPVFVSVTNTARIVKFEGGSASVVKDLSIFGTPSNPVVPEDMVFGPDGRLYICDSSGNRIFRMNPDGTGAEKIYDSTDFPNPLGPDGLPGTADDTAPIGPEGPSFLDDDLYFNTRSPFHSGVWKIPNVASLPLPSVPGPVNLIPSISIPNDINEFPFGEGTAFDPQGRFIIVDRAGDRILRASAPFTFASVIIANSAPQVPLDIARGVAVNGAGEIFVSNALLFNIIRCVEGGAGFTCSEFVRFVSPPFPSPSCRLSWSSTPPVTSWSLHLSSLT